MTKQEDTSISKWRAFGVHHKTAERLLKQGLTPEKASELGTDKLIALYGLSPEMAKAVTEKTDKVEEAVQAAVSEPVPEPVIEKKIIAAKVVEAVEPAKTTKGKPPKKDEEPAEGEADPRNLSLKERLKLIQGIIKKSGGTIGIAADMRELDYGRQPTGHMAIDKVMGGGWPIGKFSLIAGPSQTCKTGGCLDTIAADHKADPESIWVWMDAENSFDKKWAAQLGVDLSRLVVIPAAIADEMFTDCEDLIRAVSPKGVVCDSIGALLSWQEVMKDRDDKVYTKEISADTMALTARFLSKFYRRFTPLVSKHKTTFILITHVYAAIGDRFSSEVAKGGNGMMHHSHVMLWTDRRKGDQDKKQKIKMPDGRIVELYTAYEVVFTVKKTRQSGTEGQKVAIPFVYGKGLAEHDSIIEMALASGVIKQEGTWYTHPSFAAGLTAIGKEKDNGWVNGRDNTIQFVKSSQPVFEAILEDIGANMVADVIAEDDGDDDEPIQ